VVLWIRSFIFLRNQCILILRILAIIMMILISGLIRNFNLVIYLIFILIMLSGVMVIYVYFSSLRIYSTLSIRNNFLFLFFFFFFFFFYLFKYDFSLHNYYLNSLYLRIIVLLFYLLLVLFLVVKFLLYGSFSLRSK